MIGRREFITLLGGVAAAWQGRSRPKSCRPSDFWARIRLLLRPNGQPLFVQRLRELGWIEGRTIAIEYRWAVGSAECAAEIAAEFARLKVDAIFASATVPSLAAKHATATIPVIFAAAGDPVGTGLAGACAAAIVGGQ
jgi:putative tryptophan/tyrosine transport system substrate-binding protein